METGSNMGEMQDYTNAIRRTKLKLHILFSNIPSTYDHRSVKTGHPVRSAIHKH